jgi:MFS family permease
VKPCSAAFSGVITPWQSSSSFLWPAGGGRLRSTPGVLMVPWGEAFGWSRQTISFAAATGIFLFGLTGPFAAAAMQHFGIRATVITALTMMSLSTVASLFMTQPWQLILTWGVVSGIGSGCITNVLSATIVNRWFVTNRGW